VSERVAKVESLIQQVAASSLSSALEVRAAAVTVTRVDAAPDLRNATIWIGLIPITGTNEDELWERIVHLVPVVQAALAGRLTMKFVPRLHWRRLLSRD
jgi:ribosome-binding factor A